MNSVRIDPERIGTDWIPKANVAAASICESQLGENSKRASHLIQLPLSSRLLILWPWYVVEPIHLTI